MGNKTRRRGFGYIRRLPSKRWQASYTGPDLRRHNAPFTFEAALDAEAWLAAERRLITAGSWTPPKGRAAAALAAQLPTFEVFSASWLRTRELRPMTRDHYAKLLDQLILPTLGALPLDAITPAAVRAWHAGLGKRTPTYRAHAYGLLRTILASAVADELLERNPCMIRGAGSSKTVHRVPTATVSELEAIADAMPNRLRLAVLLAGWCALRFGELVELRRSDIDLKAGVIRVRRGVVRVGGQVIIGPPKSDAGVRDIEIPPHLLPDIKAHLAEHAAFGRDGLLFPAPSDPTAHLSASTLRRPFHAAAKAAGRPDLRIHDLRHTGSTLAAGVPGVSLADLMARLGHSTVSASMRYQHASQDRGRLLAEGLSELAGETKHT